MTHDWTVARNVALWQAQTELRYRRTGDNLAADRIHEKFVDLCCEVSAPNLFLAEVIRGLGRGRALASGMFEEWVVDRAFRMTPDVLGALVAADL